MSKRERPGPSEFEELMSFGNEEEEADEREQEEESAANQNQTGSGEESTKTSEDYSTKNDETDVSGESVREGSAEDKVQKSLYLHPGTSKKLKMLSAMLERPQSELAEEAIRKYIDEQAPELENIG